MTRRRIAWTGAALAAGCAGLLAASGEVPRWRSGGSAMVLHDPLAAHGPCGLAGSGPARVLFMGDSNMAGERVGGAARAFPQLAANLLGADLAILNRARGGAVLYGAAPQGDDAEGIDLVVIMFGSNDAAPRGILTRKLRWNPDRFGEDMAELVQSWRQRGAQVLVLAALPAGSHAMDRRIAPFRRAARAGAEAGGGCFRDPVAAFAAAGPGGTYLQYDGLHLSPLGQQALARWLAPLIRPAAPAQTLRARVADA